MDESSLSVLERGDAVYVKLSGNAQVDTATALKNELAGRKPVKDVAVDWESAEHVSASVLQVLFSCAKSLRQGGRRLWIEKDNPQVREYLRLAGLAGHFPPAAESHQRDADA